LECIPFDLFLLSSRNFSFYCAHRISDANKISGTAMQKPASNRVPTEQFRVEIPEIKKSLPLTKIDEELSEFERARQVSKTWSMGQD
tara:strand:- start:47 stop:307 length:261 start_codon:yes stop_codon:yes gene_type:complete